MRGTGPAGIAGLVFLLLLSFLQGPAFARDGAEELRREKGRLLEMKAREEKTAAELSEALRKEKLTRGRVNELQGRLKRQRGVIEGIDRRLSVLGERLSETEKEVRELTEAQRKARAGLRQAVSLAFRGSRAPLPLEPEPETSERVRYLMGRYLGGDLEDVERLARERRRKEEELSGIERQVAVSERKKEKERREGEKLQSRHEAERKRLSDIAREKQKKEKELRAIRAKIARMKSLVARVEREARERERLRRKKAREEAARRGKPPAAEEPEVPRRFASLAGGLSAPFPGKIVTRFGKQRDPTFDVTIENHGVELEGPAGAPVKAAASGEVAFTGAVSGFGNVLILQHGSGLFSVYGKLDDYLVKTGQNVARGQSVGRLPGSPTGKSVLYFELRAGGTAIDPASVIPLD